MRKSLSVLFCLLLLLGLTPRVQAAPGEMSVSALQDGDEVIYSFSLTPDSGIRTASFTIYYDPEQLTFEEFGKGPLLKLQNTLFAASRIDAADAIRAEYFSYNDNAEGGTIFSIRFLREEGFGADVPAIGICIEGFFDYSENLLPAVVTGDASVAVLLDGETITDEGLSARQVSPTEELFEIDTALSEPSRQFLSVNTLKEDEYVKEGARSVGEEAARSVQPFPWWGYVILGVVVLYVLIVIFRARRSIRS